MKKIIIIAVAILCGLTAKAQEWNVGGGFAHSGYAQTSNHHNGFYLALGYDYLIEGALSFSPALMIQNEFGHHNNIKYASWNAIIPLQGKVTVDVTNNVRGFVFGGPSLSYNLSNKLNGQQSYDYFHRGNIFIGAGIGVDVDGMYRIKFGYDYGLIDVYKDKNITAHKEMITLGVAYLF